jgi:aldose 1-epimerase
MHIRQNVYYTREAEMSVSKEKFGMTADGKQIMLWSIVNAGITLRVSSLGAVMVDLIVPDASGRAEDIILGYDSGEGYVSNPCFFGATIWPSANRIAGGRYEIDGHVWQMPVNDGPNNLHTDYDTGSHKRIWDAEQKDDNTVAFTLAIPDGEFGTPGNRRMQICYTVTDEGAVRLHYHGSSDRNTLLNPTNHAYYNLAGQASGCIGKQVLQLFCSHYTPVVKGAIPTGEIASVKGTPLDFTEPKPIGRDIEADFEQLKLVGGYDHNVIVDGYTAARKPADPADGQNVTLSHAAMAYDPESGRQMDVYTTLPGVQFYAGNFIDVKNGKGGFHYQNRMAFCLETQYFPDSMNHENFEHPVFGPGREYDSVTEYRFSVRK